MLAGEEKHHLKRRFTSLLTKVGKRKTELQLKGIKGFIEVSFLDWDGKVSSVLFLPGCNFRCPFCQNWQLVYEPQSIEDVEWEMIMCYLKKQKDWVDGVVLTGGEPTIYPQLIPLIEEIKKLGQKVKIDTNGYNPDVLQKLREYNLVDYVAMDIKAPLDKRYERASGVENLDLERIGKSIEFLLSLGNDYEFRTTLVPQIIGEEEIEDIGKAIKGAGKWVLQGYQPEPVRDEFFRQLRPYRREEVEHLLSLASKYAREIIYRGKWR
ncbi:MAG: anaerobic ribonucleoside-triphosphate reductase activating protein [bacterium]